MKKTLLLSIVFLVTVLFLILYSNNKSEKPEKANKEKVNNETNKKILFQYTIHIPN